MRIIEIVSCALCSLLLTSCNISKTSILDRNNEWYEYEQIIDQANDCEQLHKAYTAFYNKLIADDGNIKDEEWKQYLKTTILLERKINRKGKQLCGYTFFDVIPVTIEPEDGEIDHFEDEFEPFEDLFDYDEFDSTR